MSAAHEPTNQGKDWRRHTKWNTAIKQAGAAPLTIHGATLDEQAAPVHDRCGRWYGHLLAHHTVTIRAGLRHRVARFGPLCQSCPLRADCTKARRGRVISIDPQEAARQNAPAGSGLASRLPDLSAGGGAQDQPLHPPPLGRSKSPLPRAERVLTDNLARAGAINLARLATLGLHHGTSGWAIA